MKMSNQYVVDLADACLLCGGNDAVSISPVVPRPAGIDEQRFPRRGYKQGRLPSLYVHKKYPQCLGCLGGGLGSRRQKQGKRYHRSQNHGCASNSPRELSARHGPAPRRGIWSTEIIFHSAHLVKQNLADEITF